MTDWTLIAGGRCSKQPWRVGIVGFAPEEQQVFLLSETDWDGLRQQLPLEPLIVYGRSNGLLFERITNAESFDGDGLLLVTHERRQQPVFNFIPQLPQYLLLRVETQRALLSDETAFAKLFTPAPVPSADERLVYLDSRILTDTSCPNPEEWAIARAPDERDYSRLYHRSADFWIYTLTSAIAANAAVLRGIAPLMSIIIPTYNYGRFLEQCVRSVLDQGENDIEVLVLDNSSTDHTPQVMSTFSTDSRVRYIRNRYNYGGGYNWRNGLRIAQGRYFTFLSADDYFNPGHLSRLLPILEKNPQTAVGYTGIRWVNDQGQALSQSRHPGYWNSDYVGGRNEVADLLIHDCYMAPSAVIYRREAFCRTWNPEKTYGAGDWEMAVQMAEQYPDFAYVNTPGVSYRWHGEQESNRFYASTEPLEAHLTIVEGVFQRNAQHYLKGREREVVAHIERRLALFPGEHSSSLGVRARALIERLEAFSHPLFSIVVTTYNRSVLLADALASVGAQTLCDFEVVLINDHGEPVEHLLGNYEFPITYVYQGYNRGPAAARNAAHCLARGRYLVYLDDDDRLLPGHLSALANALEQHPGKVVYSDAVFLVERIEGGSRHVLGEERRYRHDLYSRERLLVDNYIPINTFAWPRALVAEVGGFDERLPGLEDWDFLLRLAAKTSFHHVRQETVQVRMRVGDEERRSLHALKSYPALYREIYSRHSDLGNERVQNERTAKLLQIGGSFVSGSRGVVEDWVAARTCSPAQQQLVAQRLQQFNQGPSFTVLILDMQGEGDKLSKSLESLRQLQGIIGNIQSVVLTVAQSHMDDFSGQIVTVTEEDWVAPLNQVLHDTSFDWLILVRAGDEFTANGLLMVSLELLEAPECRAVYCDELYRQSDGRLGIALRPAFNLDYLLSFPAGMAHHWLFRREVLIEAGGFDADFNEALEFEAVLRLVNIAGLGGLKHVAEPLLITDAPVLADIEDEQRAILKHLQGRGYEQAHVASSLPGRYQIDYGHVQQSLVSVLVIAGNQLARLQRCVESLLEATLYPHYELLLIESDPSANDVHEWLKALEGLGEPRLRMVWSSFMQSESAALNQAATQANGDYLLLLSPDTAVINGTWLDAMVNHAQRPEVGAVGSKLLGADGKVHRAGLVLGFHGPVGRPFVGEALDAPGYMQRLQVDQNYSALSSECLMVSKALFLEAGGLDVDPLLARQATVDLCLKLQQAGYLNVWTPNAKLLINRSETAEASSAEDDAMYERWLPLLARDPAYNSGLSLQAGSAFKLADPQLIWRPLQSWRPLPSILVHPADSLGCGHYRVTQPFEAMKSAGLIEGALSMGLIPVADLERYDPDVIVMQRQIGEERLEAMRRIKAFSRAFKVYELDDYLPNLPLKSIHRQHMPKDILKTLRRGLGYVDRFVVSTPALAEAFAGLHEDIRVIENRLPKDWWSELQGRRQVSQRPRIGWAGGSSHTGDLEMIADVVKELASEVDWVFFGMCPASIRPYVKEVHAGMAIEYYPQALAALDLDLALAPVEQNLFNECKSNLRLLEYGACGFPVICSDVRCYQEDNLPVMRVKNRFRDWVDAIRAHITDLDASARAGDALREAVLSGWMLEGENLLAWRRAWMPD